MEKAKYDYETATVSLAINETVDSERIAIPDGTIVAIGAIIAGDTEDRIINLSLLQNNNEVVRPADVRFTQKNNGGSFLESMRPVDLPGGRPYEVKIVASAASTTKSVQIQIIFMIEKPKY
ncbi:hypothetical protein [Flavobacterium commune]|uniref:Uncharacterized protein n=1 Tax=Flavobacterium commune TaxID=1306519 RepID=A0A1D9PAH8_9FLAO|nr:hypothetical protein [Flavobacterium commune]AOZ99600.1 hypothetical protein BIW12_09185 [Flavobacterium commune]